MTTSPIPDPIQTGLASGWQVIDASTLEADRQFDTDVVIIGTGAGGGVTADILSEAGLKVLLIEEGPLKSSKDFKMREAQAYAPKDVSKLSKGYVDDATPPAWVGMDVWASTICFNTVEAAKQGLKKPESWKDLLKPEYRGKIVMPNPASSGTGYFDVTAWLKLFGDKEGWSYMDKLHDNIAQYTHSGSKPCKQVAAGEFPVGISFEYRAAKLKEGGAPIDLVFPKEGLGWDVEATGIMKGTRNLDAARRLADWSASRSANELYEKNFAVVAMPGVAKPNAFIPANYEQMLIKQDLRWSASNRDTILAEWTKRYDAKSEPKK